MSDQIEVGFEITSKKCISAIEVILSTIALIECDETHTPPGDRVTFENECSNLKLLILDLYRTIRHDNFSKKELPEIVDMLMHISKIYKPLLDQFDDYMEYHCLSLKST